MCSSTYPTNTSPISAMSIFIATVVRRADAGREGAVVVATNRSLTTGRGSRRDQADLTHV